MHVLKPQANFERSIEFILKPVSHIFTNTYVAGWLLHRGFCGVGASGVQLESQLTWCTWDQDILQGARNYSIPFRATLHTS